LEGEAQAIAEADRLIAVAKERTGVLVPVSNGSTVRELIGLAARLSSPDGPPPRVLALNRGTVTGVGARVREEETRSLSRSPILAAALDAAWSLKRSITPEAIWTIDAATEIIEAAERSQVRWVLLESQRSLFGRHPTRGVVNRIMDKAVGRPVNVAVLLPSFSLEANVVTCLVTGSTHGAAAIELGRRICEPSGRTLRVLVPSIANAAKEQPAPPALPDWIRGESAGVEVQALPLEDTSLTADEVPVGLVVIAKDVADQFEVSLETLIAGRGVVLVQGAAAIRTTAEIPSVELKALAATAG
jgi:hypothetical protein